MRHAGRLEVEAGRVDDQRRRRFGRSLLDRLQVLLLGLKLVILEDCQKWKVALVAAAVMSRRWLKRGTGRRDGVLGFSRLTFGLGG